MPRISRMKMVRGARIMLSWLVACLEAVLWDQERTDCASSEGVAKQNHNNVYCRSEKD